MNLKKFYIVLSIFSIILGITLLINAEITAVGAVIGISNVNTSSSLIFGLMFLFLGCFLLLIEKGNFSKQKKKRNL